MSWIIKIRRGAPKQLRFKTTFESMCRAVIRSTTWEKKSRCWKIKSPLLKNIADVEVDKIMDFFSSSELLQSVLLEESSFILNHEKLQSHKLIKPFAVFVLDLNFWFDDNSLLQIVSVPLQFGGMTVWYFSVLLESVVQVSYLHGAKINVLFFLLKMHKTPCCQEAFCERV